MRSYRIGAELNVDPKVILASSRGRRSIDTIQLYDPSKANWGCKYVLTHSSHCILTILDVSHIESLIPKEYGSTASETPGARSLLQTLKEAHVPWALVTSCTRALLQGWLDLLLLPTPPTSVAAEDVAAGKPDPACYKLGRERIGATEQARVLVVEDSPSGVKAGKAAGCAVLGLATTHSVDRLESAGADWIVKDLESVQLVGEEGDGWKVSIEKTWSSGP